MLAPSCILRRKTQRLAYVSYRYSSSGQFKPSLLEELTARGLIKEVTRHEELSSLLENSTQGVYTGFDPTAPSLHVGHLLPLMCLVHFQLRGHKTYPLVGGATALVGDPSGRVKERDLQHVSEVHSNASRLKVLMEKFFGRSRHYAAKRFTRPSEYIYEHESLNNIDWHSPISLLGFLRTVGTKFKVNAMLHRQSVQTRMASETGITFAEFTYQLLQAYDFYYLHNKHNCSIQLGGSDQWGNIVSGLELIDRSELLDPGNPPKNDKGFAVLIPLLTTSTGEKFGKSAGNAVWLDRDMTSVFDFYQFFMKTQDADVEGYLKMFTLLPLDDIVEIMKRHSAHPELREAQRKLADEVTDLVHEEGGVRIARAATKILFSRDYENLNATDLITALRGDPRLVNICYTQMTEDSLVSIACEHGLLESKSAARTLIKAGGFYVNNRRVDDVKAKIEPSDLLDGSVIIIRAGKDRLLVVSCLESS